MSLFRGKRKAEPPTINEAARAEALQGVAASGVSIPGFENLETLARGGSSVVFKAKDLRLNRPVAIKVVPRLTSDTGEGERFQREKEIAAELGRHPHIVQVLDAGQTSDGSAYLVMEFFEKGSLADRIRSEGPLSIDESLDITIKIADALGAAHAADVLHRDVKPSNILMSQYGPALADFGISRSVSRGEWTQTLEQFTPWHAAPEILEGDNPTIQSDLYSLASTLVTLLTGRPPFSVPGDERPLAYNLRVLSDPAPTLTRADMPPGLQAFVTKALAKSPEDRYESAAAFGAALSAIAIRLRTDLLDSRVDTVQPPTGERSVMNAGTLTAEVAAETNDDWSRRPAKAETVRAPTSATSSSTGNAPEAGVRKAASEWAAPDPIPEPNPKPTAPEKTPEPTANQRKAPALDPEQLARARAIGALRPIEPPTSTAAPTALTAKPNTADDERTMVVRRGELAPPPVELADPPKQRDRFKIVVTCALLLGALLGAAIAFWPVKKPMVITTPTEANELVITPIIGASSPRNLTLVEESVKVVIGLNPEGGTETSRKETDDLDHAVEIRWDDGIPVVDATYAVVYPSGGTPRNVVIADPKSHYVSINGIKANGRYCFWLVAIKDLQNSFRSEQQCIREGRPFTFPNEASTTLTK